MAVFNLQLALSYLSILDDEIALGLEGYEKTHLEKFSASTVEDDVHSTLSPVNICVMCFSSGRTLGIHDSCHSYTVVVSNPMCHPERVRWFWLWSL